MTRQLIQAFTEEGLLYRKVLPEHESQMTRQLIPAFTEEGLLYPSQRDV
jgi:hypothetical protein